MAYHYGVDDFNKALREKERQKQAELNRQFSLGMASYKPKRKSRKGAPRKRRKSTSIFSQILNWFKR